MNFQFALGIVGAIILTAFTIYIITRLASAAHYRSKRKFLESIDMIKKPVEGERRKNDRRQSEYML